MTSERAWKLPRMEYPEIPTSPDQVLMITQARLRMAENTAGEIERMVELGRIDRALGSLVWFQALSEETELGINLGREIARELGERTGNSMEESLKGTVNEAEGTGEKVSTLVRRLEGMNAVPEKPDRDRLNWTARRYQEIFRSREFQTCLQKYQEIDSRKANWEDESKMNHLQTLQQLAVCPDQIIWEMEDARAGADLPFDPELENDAREARESTREGMVQALTKLNEKMGTEVSETVRMFPKLAQELDLTLIPVDGCISGFEYGVALDGGRLTGEFLQRFGVDTQGRTIPEKPEEGAAYIGTIPWMAFIHQGRRIMKSAIDPYPKGFPQERAAIFTAQVNRNFRVRMMTDPEVSPGVVRTLETMLEAATAAVSMDLHTVTEGDMTTVMEEAERFGVPRGARMAMVRSLTQGDSAAARFVIQGNHNVVQAATPEQAARVIEACRDQELDSYVTHAICAAMGHVPQNMGIRIPPVSQAAAEAVAKKAMSTGISQEKAQAMAEGLLENQEN